MEEKQEQSQSWKIVLVILTSCAVLMAVSYTMLIPFFASLFNGRIARFSR